MAAFTLSVSARFPGDTLEPVLISGAFLGGAIGKIIPADLSEDAISSCEIFGVLEMHEVEFGNGSRSRFANVMTVNLCRYGGPLCLMLPVSSNSGGFCH